MSDKRCSVPGCNVTRIDKIPLHSFPNPETESERFKSWLYNIGGDILGLENHFIYKRRKVCHKHFEKQYYTWTSTLSPNAIPTLNLSGLMKRAPKRPLSDVSNTVNVAEPILYPEIGEPSTSKYHGEVNVASPAKKTKTFQKPTMKKKRDSETVIRKLRQKKDSYAAKLKRALKLSENKTVQKLLQKFTTLAAMFTLMQFREIPKKKLGRRFTQEEKIMALCLYKQGPRAYRWLSKVFILPSPLTLRRLLSKSGIKPGINEKVFSQLKIRAASMSDHEKLVILLFDEMAITPHFDYNSKKDCISGFVTSGNKRKIADHALVFMLRGVIKNYKQPIAYTFCHGSTPSQELKMLIKSIITELQNCGFTILATVCDQGTTNVSAINSLIKDTQEEYLRKLTSFTHDSFEVNGEEVIPLFDPPHLIKGIRNNLITKNLKFTLNENVKMAKWEHITQLYRENPAYKGIRLMKNLTELHVDPKKMPKMKVKYATQLFSTTVASNMGYLAEKGILPLECQDTADVLLFFDQLFDSLNGSQDNFNKRSGKLLLGPVTPSSDHSRVWTTAKHVLKSMKFVTKEGKEGAVPSICNWLRTLENVDRLKNKLFSKYNFKSIWMRHFNQDPLENFFGCIRSHAWRNTSPTPAGFETAFVSLLITNVASHSRGSNCEEDFCKSFSTMKNLFNETDQEIIQTVDVDFEDVNFKIVDYNEKKINKKIIAQLCYVTGYILRQAKIKIFKSCLKCKEYLYDEKNPNDYLVRREYFNFRKCLTYPSEQIIKYFSHIQDIVTNIIEKKSDTPLIKNYCKTIIAINVDFKDFNCEEHKTKLIEFITDLSCRFFLYNWCRDVNKILNGTRAEQNVKDDVKVEAHDYYKRKNKKH